MFVEQIQKNQKKILKVILLIIFAFFTFFFWSLLYWVLSLCHLCDNVKKFLDTSDWGEAIVSLVYEKSCPTDKTASGLLDDICGKF